MGPICSLSTNINLLTWFVRLWISVTLVRSPVDGFQSLLIHTQQLPTYTPTYTHLWILFIPTLLKYPKYYCHSYFEGFTHTISSIINRLLTSWTISTHFYVLVQMRLALRNLLLWKSVWVWSLFFLFILYFLCI